MQDAQDPNESETTTSGPSTSATSSYVFKNRSEYHRLENKRRNRRSHQDHIELYNITDPDTTPSETPDKDRDWMWADADINWSP